MSILLCHKIRLDNKIRYGSRSKCLGFYKHDSWTGFYIGNNHTALAVININKIRFISDEVQVS